MSINFINTLYSLRVPKSISILLAKLVLINNLFVYRIILTRQKYITYQVHLTPTYS